MLGDQPGGVGSTGVVGKSPCLLLRHNSSMFMEETRGFFQMESAPEVRISKPKLITLTNQNKSKQSNKLIRTQSEYLLQPAPSAGKACGQVTIWFGFASKSKSKSRCVGKVVGHHANSKIIINKTILKYTK